MADSFPQVVRCVLGQGGGVSYLDERDTVAKRAEAIFGPDSIVATNYAAVVVRENLDEPTRGGV
jgi:hypothetical protein